MLLGANTVKAQAGRARRCSRSTTSRRRSCRPWRRGSTTTRSGRSSSWCCAKPHIRSLELHTLTFTGPGRRRLPALGAHHDPGSAPTGSRRRPAGASTWRDFVPSPLAHPHCYSICYVLCLDGGGYVPFTRLTSRATLFELLEDSLYIEPREQLGTVFRDLIDDLWANPDRVAESAAVLRDPQAAAERDVPVRPARCRSSSARRSPSGR